MQADGLHICVRWSQNEQLHDQNSGVHCARECIGRVPRMSLVSSKYNELITILRLQVGPRPRHIVTHGSCLSLGLGLSPRVFAARTLVRAQL